MKIFVAIPVYDGMFHCRIVTALLREQSYSLRIGDEISFNIVQGNAGIVQGRNQLATEFFDSGFDRLLFLDADITWNQGDLTRLAHRKEDVVGGAYRYKEPKEAYPVNWLPDPEKKGLWSNSEGLIEVGGLPTGFLAISRRVFEKMLEANPDRGKKTIQSGVYSYSFFQQPNVGGHVMGEDYFFCKEWRDLGGKVFLDPDIRLTHWNFQPTAHEGHIGEWLQTRAVAELAEQIREANNKLVECQAV